MSDGGLTVLDGTTLRDLKPSLPEPNGAVTGAQLVTIAEAELSTSLFNLSLPESLKSNALKRISTGAVNFSSTELSAEEAESKLRDYVIAVADELKDDPIVISVLDGGSIRVFLEDEDDFAMLAEDLFTDLDVADKGKIKKSEIRNALVKMGVELGVPPFSEFPLLEDILMKYSAKGEEELGQAQFAESLQPVLQDLADALAEKHVVIIQSNIKINNGSKLRKLLGDEENLNNLIKKILSTVDGKDESGGTKKVRDFLEKNGPILGLPPLEANESVVLLFDTVFSEVSIEKHDGELGRDKLGEIVKDILEKFVKKLETSPVIHGLDN